MSRPHVSPVVAGIEVSGIPREGVKELLKFIENLVEVVSLHREVPRSVNLVVGLPLIRWSGVIVVVIRVKPLIDAISCSVCSITNAFEGIPSESSTSSHYVATKVSDSFQRTSILIRKSWRIDDIAAHHRHVPDSVTKTKHLSHGSESKAEGVVWTIELILSEVLESHPTILEERIIRLSGLGPPLAILVNRGR